MRRIHQGSRKQIQYIYKCKFKEKDHEDMERLRSKTGDGTSNLTKAANKCNTARGVSTISEANAVLGPVPYSEATHRVIIALKSATSHRPFNAVHDKYYRLEVELLRPGTLIPHATTVSHDIKHLYVELSKSVRDYFQVCQLSTSVG